jgi:hypothetical protein
MAPVMEITTLQISLFLRIFLFPSLYYAREHRHPLLRLQSLHRSILLHPCLLSQVVYALVNANFSYSI